MPDDSKPAAIDAASVPPSRPGRGYPEPFASRVAGRERRALGDMFGLTNFGVNLTRIEPGAQSSARHAHAKQDEFIWVMEGELVLETNEGAQTLTPGMCAGFPAGCGNAQHVST